MVGPLDIRHGNKILLFLLERDEIKKTDLLEILSFSDSLSKSLQDLINAGLIKSETKVMGRKVILTKLTPLGKKVAEQLKTANGILEDYNEKLNTTTDNIQYSNNTIIECPLCGYKNPEIAKFCMRCGKRLE